MRILTSNLLNLATAEKITNYINTSWEDCAATLSQYDDEYYEVAIECAPFVEPSELARHLRTTIDYYAF